MAKENFHVLPLENLVLVNITLLAVLFAVLRCVSWIVLARWVCEENRKCTSYLLVGCVWDSQVTVRFEYKEHVGS